MWARIQRGTTSKIAVIRLEADGEPVTGKAYNTANLAAAIWQPGTPNTALTLEDVTALGTYQAPTSAAHLRLKEIDATDQPGAYELHLPDDWLASDAPDSFLLTISESGTVYAAGLLELVPPVSLTLGPTTVIQQAANVVGDGVALSMFRATQKTFVLSWLDGDGNYVTHTGKTYRFIVGDNNNPAGAQFAVDGADVVVGGDAAELVSVTVDAGNSDVDLPGGHWWLIDTDTDECPAHGEFTIEPAATSV